MKCSSSLHHCRGRHCKMIVSRAFHRQQERRLLYCLRPGLQGKEQISGPQAIQQQPAVSLLQC